MRRGLMLVAALTVAGFGCGDDSDASGGSGGTGGTGGTGGAQTQAVSIAFQAKVGDEDFVCGSFYELGSANTSLDIVDYRFFVQDVEVRNSAGDWVAVEMDDTIFQTSGVALLDFEDGCGEMGNPDTNASVTGTVPMDTYDALRFAMGIPFELNHENPATAPPPLNLTTLQWDWQGGYKFLRIDSGSFMGGGWRMHLGSTGCDGDPISGGTTECTTPNRVPVEFDGFDLDTSVVVADLAALTEGQDLGNLAPPPPGCMSGPTDPDCTSIFPNLGLPFDGAPGGDQQFFRAE